MVTFFILLAIEIVIGLFVHDAIIRPYIGDVLVVFLLYALVRGIVRRPLKLLPILLFIFASTIEVAQYYRIVDVLHLQNNKIISTIIGTSFDIKDVICYLIAAVILVIWEKLERTRRGSKERT